MNCAWKWFDVFFFLLFPGRTQLNLCKVKLTDSFGIQIGGFLTVGRVYACRGFEYVVQILFLIDKDMTWSYSDFIQICYLLFCNAVTLSNLVCGRKEIIAIAADVWCLWRLSKRKPVRSMFDAHRRLLIMFLGYANNSSCAWQCWTVM